MPKHNVFCVLVLWALTLFLALLIAVFLHESGHGLGAKIDGIHVSTGFNKVGMPGKSPDDPDFRTGMPHGVWSGLLGPMSSWALAIALTVWLYCFRRPTLAAWSVGALAIAYSLMRGIPLVTVLLRALGGTLVAEDEVIWGMWYVANICRPEFSSRSLEALQKSQPELFLSDLYFWVPILFSLAISLICLLLSLRKIYHLWDEWLPQRAARWAFGLLILPVWQVSVPLWNALDRLIRINW